MDTILNYLLMLFYYLLGLCDNNLLYLIFMVIVVCVIVKVTTKILRLVTGIVFLTFLIIKIGLMLNLFDVNTITSLIK